MTTVQPGRTSSPPRRAGRLLAWQTSSRPTYESSSVAFDVSVAPFGFAHHPGEAAVCCPAARYLSAPHCDRPPISELAAHRRRSSRASSPRADQTIAQLSDSRQFSRRVNEPPIRWLTWGDEGEMLLIGVFVKRGRGPVVELARGVGGHGSMRRVVTEQKLATVDRPPLKRTSRARSFADCSRRGALDRGIVRWHESLDRPATKGF
jgi:hypothetical protein